MRRAVCGGDYQRGGAERAEKEERRGEDFNTESTEHTEKKEEKRGEIFLEAEEGDLVGGVRRLEIG